MSESNSRPEEPIMYNLLMEHLREQKTARRWKIFFRFFFATYLFGFVGLYFYAQDVREDRESLPHVGVVDVQGVIESGSQTGASAEAIISGLRRAFDAEGAEAVVLRINSPGGSPVQSAQVYREITRLRSEYPDRNVYAVAEDIAASGAYYIASAAEGIYADNSSMVGSIGVIMSSFGFTDAMKKYGVERRVYTAGESKAFLDPFSAINETSEAHIDTMLKDIHQDFITAVRDGRGNRLNVEAEGLFSGLVWTGNQAVDIGLIDGIYSLREFTEKKLGLTRTVNYSVKPNPFEQISQRIGSSLSEALVNAVAELSLPR